jgi:hypothetical protein
MVSNVLMWMSAQENLSPASRLPSAEILPGHFLALVCQDMPEKKANASLVSQAFSIPPRVK